MAINNTVTRIKNTSGGKRIFSFLPENGRTLEADAVLELQGPINFKTQNHRAAFYAALEAGVITILQTPAEVHYDETLEAPKVLNVDNGAAAVADPSWVPAVSQSGSGSGP